MDSSVHAIRRYPVKSMAGELLGRVEMDGRGIVGDRWFAVTDEDGRLASGKDSRRFRRRDAVFDYAARTDPRGVVHVRRGEDEWVVGDRGLDTQLSADMGSAVRVLAEAGVPHQDAGAVTLVGTATLRWCARTWGGDPAAFRLRPNLVVETSEPFVEEGWLGRRLRIGTAGLAVSGRVPRCRMIDIEQEGRPTPTPWLRAVSRDRDLRLAVYLDVVSPGLVQTGEPIELV